MLPFLPLSNTDRRTEKRSEHKFYSIIILDMNCLNCVPVWGRGGGAVLLRWFAGPGREPTFYTKILKTEFVKKIVRAETEILYLYNKKLIRYLWFLTKTTMLINFDFNYTPHPLPLKATSCTMYICLPIISTVGRISNGMENYTPLPWILLIKLRK